MAQSPTKWKKRQAALEKKKTEDLEAEKIKLEHLRDSRHVWDALQLYIAQPHLTEQDRGEIRVALFYLTRGE